MLGVCCPFNPCFWYTPCPCHLMNPYLREYTWLIYQFIPLNKHSCGACHLALGDTPVQSSRSVMSDSLHPTDCSTPGLPVHHQLPEFTQTHVRWVSDASSHLVLCHPLLLLPSIFPIIRVFSNESVICIKWPKYWSFNSSISPSKEHSGLISFRMDWLDLLAVQGTLKSLLQHHSSKALILWHSAFFIVQPIHDYWKKP